MVTVELVENRLVRCGDTTWNLAQGTRFEFQFQYSEAYSKEWDNQPMCAVTTIDIAHLKGKVFHINRKYLKKVEG